ncbi:sensor histidine kinase [Pseudonocardia saturnea]
MRWWRAAERALRAADPLAADAVLATVVAALGLAQLARAAQPASGSRPADALGFALVVALCLPLVARRRAPRTVLTAVLAVALVFSVLGYQQVALALPIVLAVYTVGSHRTLRESLPVLGLLAVVLAVAYAAVPQGLAPDDVVSTVLFMVVAWWLGASIRVRRQQAELLQERAALLERARLDLATQAVAAERLRIARELHDVVAHSMSVVAVQSGMAEHVLDSQPEQARAALTAISTTSRAALAEMRHLLGVLRADGEPAGALVPVRGLDDVGELAEQVTGAGLRVRVEASGPQGVVPASVGLIGYRIVQEALTNAVRHAGAGSEVTVRLGRDGGGVSVEVVDDGGGTPVDPGRDGAGRGLAGMRERVAVVGGRLDAGPVPGGGWRVRAHLPFDGRAG